jgi:AcrR family transcriptional regulator
VPKVSEEHLEAKREMILHAAIACFARDGFHKTTMSDIASQAGVSDGLAYRYFSGKEEIIQEAVRLVSGPGQLADVDVLDTGDPNVMLRLLYRSSFERFSIPGRETTLRLRFRSWAEALDDEDLRKEVVDRWEHHTAVVELLLLEVQEQGRVPSDLDPKAIARVLLAMHDGLDLQWSFDPNLDLDACRDVVMAFLGGGFSLNDDPTPKEG